MAKNHGVVTIIPKRPLKQYRWLLRNQRTATTWIVVVLELVVGDNVIYRIILPFAASEL